MTSWSQLVVPRGGRHSTCSAFREEQLPSHVPLFPCTNNQNYMVHVTDHIENSVRNWQCWFLMVLSYCISISLHHTKAAPTRRPGRAG